MMDAKTRKGLEALREFIDGLRPRGNPACPFEEGEMQAYLATIEAALREDQPESRSQLRRIAAQKGELVPTFAPAGELTRAALSEKRLNEILAWMNGEPT